jgi:hypothetical protein
LHIVTNNNTAQVPGISYILTGINRLDAIASGLCDDDAAKLQPIRARLLDELELAHESQVKSDRQGVLLASLRAGLKAA